MQRPQNNTHTCRTNGLINSLE